MDTDYRTLREDDAAALIDFMIAVGGDTDNLTFQASDFTSAESNEAKYAIREMRKGRNVAVAAISEGKIIGTCEIRVQGDKPRIRHRADLAIALRKEFFCILLSQRPRTKA